MSTASLYPPAPPGVPPGLAKPKVYFRLLSMVVLFNLCLFLLLYVGLVIGTGYLFCLNILWLTQGGGAWLLQLGAVIGAGVLFLFLLKGLFKTRQVDQSQHLPLKEKDHPALYEFIRQLCRDTRVPLPRRIYLTYDVNAAVFYNSSLLSLFWPARKNLLIGLGLVNMLTLNEFKAVLAHEFGHFSRRGMKLGSYVATANAVLTDMVHGRDSWDEILHRWQNVDLWLRFPARALAFVVAVLRKILAGIFRIFHVGTSTLSRQSEFQADLVAVSVTGSDALVHALAKLDFAKQALIQALRDLQDASDHQLYSNDVYHQQTHAGIYLRQIRGDDQLGILPNLPDDPIQRTQIFKPDDQLPSVNWSTQPSNFDREENAKRHYIRSLDDNRSPWLLFSQPVQIREVMTRRVYRLWVPPHTELKLRPAAEVQQFIDKEHAEMTYDAKYHGLYDGRPLEPGVLNELVREPPLDPQTLTRRHAALHPGELQPKMQKHRKLLDDMRALLGMQMDMLSTKNITFNFRDKTHRVTELEDLVQSIGAELENDREWQVALDRRVFVVIYQMAKHLDPDWATELVDRYTFQQKLQEMTQSLNEHRGRITGILHFLNSNTQPRLADREEILHAFDAAHQALRDCLGTAEYLELPTLKNVIAGQPLKPTLLDEPLLERVDKLDGQWVADFYKQLLLVLDRLGRMHAKSVGGILALQEKIGEQWQQDGRGEGP